MSIVISVGTLNTGDPMLDSSFDGSTIEGGLVMVESSCPLEGGASERLLVVSFQYVWQFYPFYFSDWIYQSGQQAQPRPNICLLDKGTGFFYHSIAINSYLSF
jgi:hypothetical protein